MGVQSRDRADLPASVAAGSSHHGGSAMATGWTNLPTCAAATLDTLPGVTSLSTSGSSMIPVGTCGRAKMWRRLKKR